MGVFEFSNFELKETFKLEGYTPHGKYRRLYRWLEETFKLEGYTPMNMNLKNKYMLEETFKLV